MRYLGGKQRIAEPLSLYLNSYSHRFTTFVDLFCGSLNITSRVCFKDRIANDSHPYLMAMWSAVQQGWEPPETVSEGLYLECRQHPDRNPALTGFVGFGCSFGGKWFGGYARSKGSRNYASNARNSVLRKIRTCTDVTLVNKQWHECPIPSGSLVYADVPYKNTTGYSAVTGGFSWDVFMDWARSHPNVVISEYAHNVPADGHIIWEKPSKRDMRGTTSRQNTTEVLFTFSNEVIE